MPQIHSVRSLVDSFIADLELMTKRAALEQVLAALQGGVAPAQQRGRRSGGKPGRRSGRPAGSANRAATKIDPEKLFAYVKAHPGSRGEQVAAGMRSDVARIRPAMLELIAAKRVRTTGQRRGMQYFAGTAGPRASTKGSKKRAKKVTRVAKRAKRTKAAKRGGAGKQTKAGRRTKRTTKAMPTTAETQEKAA
jgi:hypothetical protein